MELITGQRSMSAKSLLRYFEPLTDWLKEQNKGGDDIGWGDECPEPVAMETDLDKAAKWLQVYNVNAQREINIETLADWNYAANITDENQRNQVCLIICMYSNFMTRFGDFFDRIHPIELEIKNITNTDRSVL
jgi:hypothetical protein